MIKKSIIKFKETVTNGRIDADYYSPEYLKLDADLIKKGFNFLGDPKIKKIITDGDHGNPIYNDGGEPYIKSKDLFDFDLDLWGIEKVDKTYSSKISQRCRIKKNDILLTTVGTIGVSYLAQEKESGYLLSRDIARIGVNSEEILPEFLYIFLKTRCGRMQIERFSSGSVQRGLYLESIKKIKIPSIEISNQKEIISNVKEIYECIKKSKEAYEEAKLLVKKEININESKIVKKKSFIKNFSESLENKRIDADYYRSDYESLINQIKDNRRGYIYLSKKNIKNKNFIPDGEKRYNYVELADINSSLGLIEKCLNEYGANLPTRARRFVNEGDIIISSIEGSLKSSAIINLENAGFICSNGFFVLKSEEYFPEFLLVLMKNDFIQLLLKRGCSGTILSAISSEEIIKIPLPKIDKTKQTEVVKLVKESHKYYYEARDILKKTIIKVEKNIGIDYGK